MKKIYTLLLALAAGSALSISAQQLPNAGFENSWANTTPYTGGNSKTTDGKSPANWTIAHVAGYKLLASWLGTTTVGGNTTGYNSTYAAQLVNSPNSVATSQTVPGYMTLGTTWNTANTSGGNKDGGSFGSYGFTYRPDAMSIQYKRIQASGSSEQATVIAYMWKGTATQANVPVSIGGSPTKVTMTDRDRNILGMSTSYGDTPQYSSDYEKIATINHAITSAANDWTYLELPFNYASTSSNPTKINVIFAASNYFSTTPEVDNELIVDDVKLLYYSRLASLSVNGTAVNGFNSNTYSYTIDSEMPEATAFAYTTMGNSGSATANISLDTQNAVATITVTNSNAGGTDVDGQTSHTYTIQFNKKADSGDTPSTIEGTKYNGTLNIKLELIGLDVTQNDNVYIKDNGNGTCLFTLPNFVLTIPGSDPANFGDIVVDNVNMTTNGDGSITYSGSVKGLSLAGGEVIADVELSGTEVDGALEMNIPVLWEGLTIDVTFNGQKVGGGEEGDDDEPELEYCTLTGTTSRTDERGISSLTVTDNLGNEVTVTGPGVGMSQNLYIDQTSTVFVTNPGATVTVKNNGSGNWMHSYLYIDFDKNGTFDVNEANCRGANVDGELLSHTGYTGIQTGSWDKPADPTVYSDGTPVDNGASYSCTMPSFTLPADLAPGTYRVRHKVDWNCVDPCGRTAENGYYNDYIDANGGGIIDFILKIDETSGIDDIEINNSDAPVEYFNINGIRVNAENLTPGLYIIRQGTDVKKVLVK